MTTNIQQLDKDIINFEKGNKTTLKKYYKMGFYFVDDLYNWKKFLLEFGN